MDHEVDPQLLQEALDATYDRYRLYHAVLRSGVFYLPGQRPASTRHRGGAAPPAPPSTKQTGAPCCSG